MWKKSHFGHYFQRISILNFVNFLCFIFGSTYICESTFSLMKIVKSMERNRLTDDNLHYSLRLTTTEIDIDIDKLVREKES